MVVLGILYDENSTDELNDETENESSKGRREPREGVYEPAMSHVYDDIVETDEELDEDATSSTLPAPEKAPFKKKSIQSIDSLRSEKSRANFGSEYRGSATESEKPPACAEVLKDAA